jgi:GT2 family glycosyltransferase
MISVIICTAFRPQLLLRCLNSVIAQNISSKDFEIIVINNAPINDDEIKEIVSSLKTSIKITYALEKQVGLSFARNLGIKVAEGDILVFIDDDAYATPNWLENLQQVYNNYPDAGAVGGRITLFWDSEIPNWLHPNLFGYLGEFNYGEQIIRIEHDQYLAGGNYSVRRKWIEKCGVFCENLGRNQNSLLSGEEVELTVRLQKHGCVCYYSNEALVYHPAPKERINKKFFRERAYWGSRSNVIIDFIHFPKSVFSKLTAKLIRLPYQYLKSIKFFLIGDFSNSFLLYLSYWKTLGYLIGVLNEFFFINRRK